MGTPLLHPSCSNVLDLRFPQQGFSNRRCARLQRRSVAYNGLAPPDGWVAVHGIILVGAFLAGIVLFVFSDKVPHSRRLFLLSLIATVALLLVPRGDFFVSFPAAYV